LILCKCCFGIFPLLLWSEPGLLQDAEPDHHGNDVSSSFGINQQALQPVSEGRHRYRQRNCGDGLKTPTLVWSSFIMHTVRRAIDLKSAECSPFPIILAVDDTLVDKHGKNLNIMLFYMIMHTMMAKTTSLVIAL
jgi:hypothetical protein